MYDGNFPTYLPTYLACESILVVRVAEKDTLNRTEVGERGKARNVQNISPFASRDQYRKSSLPYIE